MLGQNNPPSLFLKEKCRSAKSDVSKVLFPHIGKITNLPIQVEFPFSEFFHTWSPKQCLQKCAENFLFCFVCSYQEKLEDMVF